MPMGLFDMFSRREPPIGDDAALAEFIDGNAAFVTQKGLYEYSRVRAGHYAKVLFKEPTFQTAIEAARWRAYPIGLAMVGEIVDSVLHENAAGDRHANLKQLNELVLSVFDRYPVPAAIGATAWRAAREELDRRLKLISVHPPKRAMDIPEPYAQAYFDTMPIHEQLRGRDFSTTHNYLKVTLCNVHDVLSRRINRAAFDAQPAVAV
jgi:hypothetical protein